MFASGYREALIRACCLRLQVLTGESQRCFLPVALHNSGQHPNVEPNLMIHQGFFNGPFSWPGMDADGSS